jgi:uncharacterized damage-inducible protein DinB
VPEDEFKADLHRYLREARDALVWKLDGLSEYDVRRPMTPTGTNLLGLVKHVAAVSAGYFGEVFNRPFREPLPWYEPDADPQADLFASADESRAFILDFWRAAWAHSDATIEALPLDAPGEVPWWPPERRGVTLHRILVHVLNETCRHAGHADIVRETVDGTAGVRVDNANLPELDAAEWAAYRQRLEETARSFAGD